MRQAASKTKYYDVSTFFNRAYIVCIIGVLFNMACLPLPNREHYW